MCYNIGCGVSNNPQRSEIEIMDIWVNKLSKYQEIFRRLREAYPQGRRYSNFIYGVQFFGPPGLPYTEIVVCVQKQYSPGQ